MRFGTGRFNALGGRFDIGHQLFITRCSFFEGDQGLFNRTVLV
jgi:hypothetical protein